MSSSHASDPFDLFNAAIVSGSTVNGPFVNTNGRRLAIQLEYVNGAETDITVTFQCENEDGTDFAVTDSGQGAILDTYAGTTRIAYLLPTGGGAAAGGAAGEIPGHRI